MPGGWHHGGVETLPPGPDDAPPRFALDRPPGAELDEPFDPSQIRDPLPQPLFSWRRLAILGALAVAVACLVVAGRSGGSSGEGEGYDRAIVSYLPAPGGRVPRQSEVGVELAPGYDGRLTINGVPIPETEMLGAIVPGTEAYAQLSEDQRRLGPRPNNKNVVKYRTGEGKAVPELDTGAVQMEISFWRVAEGPQAARQVSYTIRVY